MFESGGVGVAVTDLPALTRARLAGLDPATWSTVGAAVAAERVEVRPGVVLPEFAALPGGAELAAALDAVDPADLDDTGWLELAAAAERVKGWAEAVQARALAGFAGHRPRRPPAGTGPDGPGSPGGPGGSGGSVSAARRWRDVGFRGQVSISQFTVDEIAARLAWGKGVAGERLATALDLTERLPATWTALSLGALDAGKARTLSRAARLLEDSMLPALEATVLPGAPRATGAQFHDRVRRQVATLDPEGALERAETARAARRVEVRPEDDTVASLRLLAPAEDVVAVYGCLDLLARHARPDGDPRTLDQARADALTHLVTTHPAITGACPCQHPHPSPPTLPAPGAVPGALPGPVDPVAGDGFGFTAPVPAGGFGSTGRRKALVHLTVAATTLLGLDHVPADLAGYGPVPADLARQMAAGDTEWTRLLTHPITGAVLASETTTHDPPAAMAALVTARDRTCRFITCNAPAHTGELDHTPAWPAGTTSPTHLASECWPHHKLRHLAGWTLTREHGQFVWTSPAGHVYRLDPETVGVAIDAITRGRYTLTLTDPPPDHEHPDEPDGLDPDRPDDPDDPVGPDELTDDELTALGLDHPSHHRLPH